MTLSQKVVKRPILVTVVFLLLVIVAIYSIQNIPLELMPTSSPPM